MKTTRRTFLKGVLAAGALAGVATENLALAQNTVPTLSAGDNEAVSVITGTTAHNCGGRCATRAVISGTPGTKSARIVRILSDEREGVETDDLYAKQSRACSRCRGYMGRLYHPGRLKYPMKQVKSRGDLSGFVRISWEEAIDEITRKYNAITSKYGAEAFYPLYASGQQGRFQRGGVASHTINRFAGFTGGYVRQFGSYSAHQVAYTDRGGHGFSGMKIFTTSYEAISKHSDVVFLWGSHLVTAVNPASYPLVRALEDVRNRGGKVIYIGPSLEPTGATTATEWVQIRPYTDGALINAMLYHLINKGKIDNDYVDAMVYGFYDSPEYWLNPENGEISMEATEGFIKIDEVPAGKSLASYIMGNKKGGKYVDTNYTSSKFASKKALRYNKCSYPVAKATKYHYKKDMYVPKSPAWASKITGIPESKIIELAEILADSINGKKNIYHEYSYGLQRQAEGVTNMLAVQGLAAVTKCWGKAGTGWGRTPADGFTGTGYDVSLQASPNPIPKQPSCTIWHDAIKFGFDIDPKKYPAKHIPILGNPGKGKSFVDDASVKSLVKHTVNTEGSGASRYKTYKDADGKTYYDWEGRENGKPVYIGVRFLLNIAGNTLVNQHMNTNDTADFMSALPLSGPDDADGFCIVTTDNFLTSSARWSDYIFPGATNWEMVEYTGGMRSITGFYLPKVIEAPGESRSSWEFCKEFTKGVEKNSKGRFAGLYDKYVVNGTKETEDQWIKEQYEAAATKEGNLYNGVSFEWLQKNSYVYKNAPDKMPAVPGAAIRSGVDAYLAGDKKAPFVSKEAKNWIETNGLAQLKAAYFGAGYCPENEPTCPNPSGRFHAYYGSMVWEYEHRNEMYHGYLPVNERGQKNRDEENDAEVYPITMYFHFQDYMRNAYGKEPNFNPNDPKGELLITSVHSKYRSHSTHGQNPYMRELFTYTSDGKAGRDKNSFQNFPDDPGNNKMVPTIAHDGTKLDENFAYTVFYMNPDDAKVRGIKTGDIVYVRNSVGTVKVSAELTYGISRGTAILNQGAWYNPIEENGEIVDYGGCVNTLVASLPSRIDRGNAQMSAIAVVAKA